jgi:uncharacterized NAD-dependent epimerase/dehydratase family protein
MAFQTSTHGGLEALERAVANSSPVDALVYTADLLNVDFAKTCHGLLRGSNRFNVRAVIDSAHAGQDAGKVMDGNILGIPIYKKLRRFLEITENSPRYFVLGVAFSGGQLPESCRTEIVAALCNGMHVVSGLHQFLADDDEFAALARQYEVDIIDIRRPSATGGLRFWTGEVEKIPSAIIPILGTDCAVGKRTTSRFLWEACRATGINADMIYTGQTGWMQGYRHGFLFDATPNDFVSGEIERVLLESYADSQPDVIFVEGQGALRNPSGPCGSEFLVSADPVGVILQHDPARTHFVDHEKVKARIPTVEEEIALINMFGVDVLAVTLNESSWRGEKMDAFQAELRSKIDIPVVRPLSEGVDSLVEIVRAEAQL